MNNNSKTNSFISLRAQLKRERERTEKLSALIEELSSEEKLYERVRNNEAIKRRIIADYISSLTDNNSVALISGGITALTPVPKPKTLQDAKRLADKIIKS